MISIAFTLVTDIRSKSATRCLTVSLKGKCVHREKICLIHHYDVIPNWKNTFQNLASGIGMLQI